MTNHAKYSSLYQPTLDAVLVTDLCLPETRSVTNDAEKVVADVVQRHGNKQIFYRDTDGRWDELVHTDGVFERFAPIGLNVEKFLRKGG